MITLGDVKPYSALRLSEVHRLMVQVELDAVTYAEGYRRVINPSKTGTIERNLAALATELAFFNLTFTRDAIIRFEERVSLAVFDDLTPDHVSRAVENIRERLEDELKNLSFFYVEPSRIRFYDKTPPDGDGITASFPSAEYDLREAGNCLSLDRFTATVMHSMRALEPGLDALADVLGIKRGNSGWGRDLNNLQTAWSAKSSDQSTPNWMRLIFPPALAEFRYFAEAWRNRSMHARARYGEEEAGRVLEHVLSFLRILAPKLNEPNVVKQP